MNRTSPDAGPILGDGGGLGLQRAALCPCSKRTSVARPFRLLLALAFGVFWIFWFAAELARKEGDWPRGDRLFGALFLVAAGSEPLVPHLGAGLLAHVTRRVGSRRPSLAVLLSYAMGLHLGDPQLEPYEVPGVVLVLEYGAIAAALAWDRQRGSRGEFSAA